MRVRRDAYCHRCLYIGSGFFQCIGITEKKEEIGETIEVKPDIIEVEISASQCSEPSTSNNLNEPEIEEPTENQNDVVT